MFRGVAAPLAAAALALAAQALPVAQERARADSNARFLLSHRGAEGASEVSPASFAEVLKGKNEDQDEVLKGKNEDQDEVLKGKNEDQDEVLKGKNEDQDEVLKGKNEDQDEVLKGKNEDQDEVLKGKNEDQDEEKLRTPNQQGQEEPVGPQDPTLMQARVVVPTENHGTNGGDLVAEKIDEDEIPDLDQVDEDGLQLEDDDRQDHEVEDGQQEAGRGGQPGERPEQFEDDGQQEQEDNTMGLDSLEGQIPIEKADEVFDELSMTHNTGDPKETNEKLGRLAEYMHQKGTKALAQEDLGRLAEYMHQKGTKALAQEGESVEENSKDKN